MDQENGRLQWVVRLHCDRLCPVWVFPFDLVVGSWSTESTGFSESKGSDAGCVAPSLDGSAFLGWSSRLVFAARGMRLLARGSWLVAHGSWRMAHGSWLMAHGTWLMVRAVLIKFTLVYEMSPCICEFSHRNVWSTHIELCGGLRRMYDQTV